MERGLGAGAAAIIETGAAITVQAAYRGWKVRNASDLSLAPVMTPQIFEGAAPLATVVSTPEAERLARLEAGMVEIKGLLLQQQRQQQHILEEHQHQLLVQQQEQKEQQEKLWLLQTSPGKSDVEGAYLDKNDSEDDTSSRRRQFLLREGGGGGGSFMLAAPDILLVPSLLDSQIERGVDSSDDGHDDTAALRTGAAITVQAAYRGWYTRRKTGGRINTSGQEIVGISALILRMSQEHDLDYSGSFARYDVDGNEFLDKSEVKAMLRAHEPAFPSDDAFVSMVIQAFGDGTWMTVEDFAEFWKHVGSPEGWQDSNFLQPDEGEVGEVPVVGDESDSCCDEGMLAAVQNESACIIQSVYRGRRERLRLKAQWTAECDPDGAATMIQAAFRSCRLRHDLNELIAMGMSPEDIAAVLSHVLI